MAQFRTIPINAQKRFTIFQRYLFIGVDIKCDKKMLELCSHIFCT